MLSFSLKKKRPSTNCNHWCKRAAAIVEEALSIMTQICNWPAPSELVGLHMGNYSTSDGGGNELRLAIMEHGEILFSHEEPLSTTLHSFFFFFE
jgi:hypothetical protein